MVNLLIIDVPNGLHDPDISKEKKLLHWNQFPLWTSIFEKSEVAWIHIAFTSIGK